MKKYLAVTLGILTAIGGFVDIGDLVTNALVGARFGMSLTWAVVVGVIGIVVFAEMSGRIAAVSGRPVFDLVRRVGDVPQLDLERTLNCGVGMVALVAPDDTDAALGLLAGHDVDAWVAGEVLGDGSGRVSLTGQHPGW